MDNLNIVSDKCNNHLYIDHFGYSAYLNGKKFKPYDLTITSSNRFEHDNKVIELFYVLLENGTIGVLIFHSTDPYYKAKKNFINRCLIK